MKHFGEMVQLDGYEQRGCVMGYIEKQYLWGMSTFPALVLYQDGIESVS